MERERIIETTLGDLIAALTDETAPYVHDEKDAYKVVAFALTRLLKDSSAGSKRYGYWQ